MFLYVRKKLLSIVRLVLQSNSQVKNFTLAYQAGVRWWSFINFLMRNVEEQTGIVPEASY
jgi:hypothetical protein